MSQPGKGGILKSIGLTVAILAGLLFLADIALNGGRATVGQLPALFEFLRSLLPGP